MFNLEKAIYRWRKALNRNEALEDGYKNELENHLRDKIEYLIGFGAMASLQSLRAAVSNPVNSLRDE